ncbi:VTT domain-containing protein [Plantibacter sp. YIM 135347]|uniref:VTT domain-containing protein n=1 Tax=Plantibacter sp. YIM 135347 TaxID=3423919 RepID=UPI003D326F46
MDWLAAIPPAALLGVVFVVVAVESLGVPLPGETVLITTTLLAATSGLSPVWVAAAAAAGAIIGDSVGYFIGSRYGRRIISVLNRKFPKHVGPKRLGVAVHLMRRWGPWAVFFGRFVAVLRIFSGPLAGMFRMPYPIFLAANAAGGIIWASLVVTVVTLLGKAATEILHRFSWAALAIAGVVAIVIAIVVVYRARRRAASGQAPEPVVSLTEEELDELLSPEGAVSLRAASDERVRDVAGAADAVAGSGVIARGGSTAPGSTSGSVSGTTPTSGIEIGVPVPPARPAADLRAAVRYVFTPLRWAFTNAPATSGFLIVFIALGVVTEGLWRPIHTASWYSSVAFGVPSFQDGHWWTIFTGMFLTTGPAAYVIAILGIGVFGGWVEVRFGTLRAAAIFVGGHLIGILGAVGFALLFAPTGWEWAQTLTTTLDVGPSCGILACIATATAFMRSPYRLRWRLLLIAWVSIAVLYVGHISDLEHFISVIVFVIVARVMVGEHRSTSRPTERDWRLYAVAGLVILGVVQILITLVPLEGPLGPTTLTQGTWTDVLFDTIAIIVIVNWLRRGHRWAWWAAMALTVVNLLVTALLVTLILVAGVTLDFAAVWLSTTVLWIAEAALLIGSRHAFRVSSNQTRRRLPDAIGPGARRSRRIASGLLAEHGGGPLATVALRPQNRVFLTPDEQHAIGYQQHGGVALAIGDPIGAAAGRAEAIAAFADAAERVGLTPSVFAATDPADAPEGWRVSPLGRDLVVRPADIDGSGISSGSGSGSGSGISSSSSSAVRALDAAVRDYGLRTVVRPLADQTWEIRSQARALDSVWTTDKHVPELGLTVGGSSGSLREVARTSAVLDRTGTLLAAVTWLPVDGPGGVVTGWSLDLVVRAIDGGDEHSGAAAGGVVGRPSLDDAVRIAVLAACRAFAAEGAQTVSLAPSGLGQDHTEPDGVAVRAIAGIASRVEPRYGAEDLAAFAAELGAETVPLYLFCREDTDQPRVSYAIARGFLPASRLGDLANLSGALLTR